MSKTLLTQIFYINNIFVKNKVALQENSPCETVSRYSTLTPT